MLEDQFSTTDIPTGDGLLPPPLSGQATEGDAFDGDDEPAPEVRPSVLRPVVGVLAWLLVLGVIAGCSYVFIQSLGGGPDPALADAAPQSPEPPPLSIEELMSAVSVNRTVTRPAPARAPEDTDIEDGPNARGKSSPETGPSATPSPPAPIPGVALDECDWDELPTDPALRDEQVAAALLLQGYVFEGDKRCAISGRMFREGDRVGRFVVERIDREGVLIRSDGFTGWLRPGQQGAVPARKVRN